MSDLDSEIKAVAQEAQDSGRAVGERLQRQQADDRSLIAKVIIFSFVGLVIAVVAAAIYGAYAYDWEALVEPGKFLMTVLGSIMLPVVTLVIGYYFGSK